MQANKLSGSLNAAILIHSLGRPAALHILNRLTEEERELISRQLSQMGTVSPDVVEQIAKEFTDLAQRVKLNPKKLVAGPANALHGTQESGAVASELPGLKAILALNADDIFDLVKDEHPQTISIILIHLDTAVASDIISKLPDEIKADVAMRITSLDKVNADMVEEINDTFKEILKNKKTVLANVSGGVDRLAEMLNQADEISSELILNEIEEANAELAAEIKQKMFVFEDLILVDDRGFQKFLRKIETAELAIALKAASEDVKEKVFRNMSERAGLMLSEEMEDMGPVRMKEVLDAQQKIATIIQEMEARGEIIISGRRGEEIIN
ncbi:MAG: flagellar motor switch protein FliG [Desulfobacterales bacterium]|nr:MAG: flagellar motor switch protein FliG [Desulfobacterales bacterium]